MVRRRWPGQGGRRWLELGCPFSLVPSRPRGSGSWLGSSSSRRLLLPPPLELAGAVVG